MPFGIAAILGGTSLLGGIISGGASQSAANTQAQAANQASQTQQNEFNQIQQNLAPYLNTGASANDLLLNLLGGAGGNPFSSPLGYSPPSVWGPAPTYDAQSFSPPTYNLPQFTQQQFQQSPGYNYALQQTQNATRNAATPGQGTLSGATLRGLQGNAAGLASQDWYQALGNYQNNYNNQYNAQNQSALNQFNAGTTNANALFNSQSTNYWNDVNAVTNQQSQIFNFLNQLAGRGASTGATQGSLGATTAAQIGQNQIGAGNALSAGTLGTGNAIGQALQGVTGTLTAPSNMSNNSLLAQLLYGGGAYGGTDTAGIYGGNQNFSGGAGY